MKTKFKNVMFAATLMITAAACNENNNEFLIPKGENNEVKVENSVYTHQTFYDLSTNSEVLTVDVNEWDLSVETSGRMETIKLNPARGYRVFRTISTDITDEITLPDVPDWKFDDPSYDPTEQAFYGWVDNIVYVIGKKVESFDPTVSSIEIYAKVSFVKTSEGIKIRWMLSKETEVHDYSFSADPGQRPFAWFSFETGGPANIQPPLPSEYDITFSTFTEKIFDGTASYIFDLRGALTNREGNVRSYRYLPGEATDEEYNDIFNNLTASDIDAQEFEIDADVIGYNWKVFNRTSMSYEINKSNMYFIMDSNGNYYKIRFTNYYNSEGEKGYISFTYALL